MATLTIRGLDEGTKARLRLRAASHGTSMEGEARAILDEVLARPRRAAGVGSRLHTRLRQAGAVDLDVPDRTDPGRAADFGH